MSAQSILNAGAAAINISPHDSQFLYGYPHVQRMSTGIHDPLFSSALYLDDGQTQVMFIANDIIWVPGAMVRRAQQRISEATGVPAQHIMISASHTHSAPIVGHMIVADADPIVPREDPAYMQLLEDGIVEAARQAHAGAQPAQIGVASADATGIGTNRHDPAGPSRLDTPVLAVRNAGGQHIALMVVCYMHPTVLHEDSTLVSGDFPGLARQYLQQQVVGENCPVVYHMGTAGNQSPRHVTKSNTFDEAARLGEILGKAIEAALAAMAYTGQAALACEQTSVDLPLRQFPAIEQAEAEFTRIRDRFEQLKADGAPRQEVRTAECDLFGAEETVTLARAAAAGQVAAAAERYSPAEVMLIRVGDWSFVGWPGEVFVEYGLMVRDADPNAFVITLVGGDLQGYLATQQGIDEHWYEANNALFQSPDSPERFVEATRQLLSNRD